MVWYLLLNTQAAKLLTSSALIAHLCIELKVSPVTMKRRWRYEQWRSLLLEVILKCL